MENIMFPFKNGFQFGKLYEIGRKFSEKSLHFAKKCVGIDKSCGWDSKMFGFEAFGSRISTRRFETKIFESSIFESNRRVEIRRFEFRIRIWVRSSRFGSDSVRDSVRMFQIRKHCSSPLLCFVKKGFAFSNNNQKHSLFLTAKTNFVKTICLKKILFLKTMKP